LNSVIFKELKNKIKPKYNIKGSSGTHARTRTSFKILTGIWLLSMVVLINAYSGVLTSLLTATKLNPIAKTMKDIAESKDLRLTTEKNFFLQERFLVSFI